MIFRFRFLKPPAYALIALVLLTFAMEVGVRAYDSVAGLASTQSFGKGVLVVESWLTHHRLIPLQTFDGQNPDTKTAVKIVTNSFGLRGPEPAVPKPPGIFRIICLGDETVLGAEVTETKTFCVRLRQLLEERTRLQVEVINAGVPGYCPLLSYLQVKHELLALQPDVLILNFDMSDVAEDYKYRRHTFVNAANVPLSCPNPALGSRAATGRRRPADQFAIVQWGKSRLGWLWQDNIEADQERDIASHRGKYLWLEHSPTEWSVHIRQTLSSIEHLKKIGDGIHAWTIVATYPTPWQVSAAASNGPGVRKAAGVNAEAVFSGTMPFDVLADYTARHAILFCNTSQLFRNAPNAENLFLRNVSRFSAQGHELYARKLAVFLVNNIPGIWTNGSSNSWGNLVQPHQTRPESR